MANSSNRRRGLADVVSLEAWRRGYRGTITKTGLYINVVFQNGRLGDSSDEVRFKLALKRAEVVVVIPAGEPAVVDVASVERDGPTKSVQKTETRRSKNAAGVNLVASGAIDPNIVTGSLSASSELAAERAREQTIEISESLDGITVVHSTNDKGDHRWTLTPSADKALLGKPWESKSPRLKIIDRREPDSKNLPPAVHVEVRCLREDLDISDITLRDESLIEKLKNAPGFRNRIIAAEALIRTRLFEERLLEPGADINDPRTKMVIAAIIVEGD